MASCEALVSEPVIDFGQPLSSLFLLSSLLPQESMSFEDAAAEDERRIPQGAVAFNSAIFRLSASISPAPEDFAIIRANWLR